MKYLRTGFEIEFFARMDVLPYVINQNCNFQCQQRQKYNLQTQSCYLSQFLKLGKLCNPLRNIMQQKEGVYDIFSQDVRRREVQKQQATEQQRWHEMVPTVQRSVQSMIRKRYKPSQKKKNRIFRNGLGISYNNRRYFIIHSDREAQMGQVRRICLLPQPHEITREVKISTYNSVQKQNRFKICEA